MAENSPEIPQVKHESWQQMHDGLFWPRYEPLLPGHAEETIAANLRLVRLVEYLIPYLRDRHP